MVLEGGATRGVFTSGVLDFLMEQDFWTSYVVGVSAGACNAVDYVSRQIGRTRDCMIPQEKRYDYHLSPRKAVQKRSLMDMELIFDTFPKEVFPFDFTTYFASETVCELVVTNCLTGEAEYLTEREDPERLLLITRASSSMPLASPMVVVDGTPYLDGGLADSIPVERGRQKGYRKQIVILTRQEGYRKKLPSPLTQRLFEKRYGRYPQLMKALITRNQLYNRTLNLVSAMEKRGEIFVLRPQIPTIGRMERDREKLLAFYRHGYELMQENFERLQAYLKA